MPAKKELSLLPDSESSNSLASRALKWVTTVGRFIIVFTELIVISAFLSRFWLDRKNSDLSEVLRQQKAILESTQEFENEYGTLKRRLELVKQLYSAQPNFSDVVTEIVQSTPPEIVFSNLSCTFKDKGSDIDLSLIAYKEEDIVNYVSNLIVNPRIDKVSVTTINKKTKDPRYYFDITLTLKPQT